MSHTPPRKVWISWCDGCGMADYAYNEMPKEAGGGCPRCETDRQYQRIAGPYVLATAPEAVVPGMTIQVTMMQGTPSRGDYKPVWLPAIVLSVFKSGEVSAVVFTAGSSTTFISRCTHSLKATEGGQWRHIGEALEEEAAR